MGDSTVSTHCTTCVTRFRCLFFDLFKNTFSPGSKHGFILTEHTIPKGTVAQKEGHVSTCLQVVKAGYLYGQRAINGQETPVSISGPGHVLGALSVLQAPCPISSVAYTDVRVCRASQADAILQFGHTDAAQKFGLLLHKAMQELVHWVDIHRINGIPARAESALRHLTGQQGSRMGRIPEQAVFARLLGCSRETLARSLQHLEQQGRIRRAGRGHIEVNMPFYDEETPQQGRHGTYEFAAETLNLGKSSIYNRNKNK